MKYNIMTGEAEGTPEEIARLLAEKQSFVPKPLAETKKVLQTEKVYYNQKYTADVIDYLRKEYALGTKEKILADLKNKFGIEVKWLSVCQKAGEYGIRRNRGFIFSKVRQKEKEIINKQPYESLEPTKICKGCGNVFHRGKTTSNFSWKNIRFCYDCFKNNVHFKRRASKKIFQDEDEFPRFSSILADNEDIKQVFYDLIANKGRIGREKWESLKIDSQNQWEFFCSEAAKRFERISGYYLSPNLFSIVKEGNNIYIRYGVVANANISAEVAK